MNQKYHTGLHIHNYEITISQRGKLGVERVLTVENLPHSTHESFQQKLMDALINAGISIAQKEITHRLKNA